MQNSQLNSVADAVRRDNFSVADLSSSHCGEIQELEKKLSENMGKQISLVAYESQSR